ncbi:triose-phosphate isomerase [Desmospora profundinema]|uniref:Triosephosphate isomerase n=1 Tax=Desmospora profundinema TaxID=1571184 RepID=A0ABU1ILK3_9BACL|nr:triose-phosphate isomerase [Desmospora profundinema]MDR6225658.1 triosephosphate isomerase [Desmospora profundinema]
MRIPVIAGNWKMHKTISESLDYLEAFRTVGEKNGVETVLCGPFLTLPALVEGTENSSIGIGAQNMHWEEQGAFTGEVSPSMLRDLGVPYVIVGHSERRTLFGETDESVRNKVRAALAHDLVPILCVGETIEEREDGRTQEIVRKQTVEAVQELSSKEMARVIVAYEPVWAIGTGRSATAEDAQDVVAFIRRILADQFDQQVANQVRILYGGSVKPANIDELLQMDDIDGALVGGASLDPESFGQLVDAAARRGNAP